MSLAWTTEEDIKLHGLDHSTVDVGSPDIVQIKPPDDAGDGEDSNIHGQEGDVVCHGVHYAVVTSFPSRCTLRVEVEVEAKDGSGRWVGDFSKQYLEGITRKTGSYKSFDEFRSMLHAALAKKTEMVTVDLLAYGDLDELKKHRLLGNKDISYSAGASGSGLGIVSSSTSTASSHKQNSKRYIILTDMVNDNMVHYPLPLALQTHSSTIPNTATRVGPDNLKSTTLERGKKEYENVIERQSKSCQEKEQQTQHLLDENQKLRQQLENAQSLKALEMAKIRADAQDLRTQLGEAEANYNLMRSECSNEIRHLSGRLKNEGRGKEMGSSYYKLRARSSNLELELAEMREKSRKSCAHAKYEAEVEYSTQAHASIESELNNHCMKTELGLKRDIRREAAVSRALRSQVRELQRRIRELEAELKDVDEKIHHRNRGGLLSSRPKAAQQRHRSQTGRLRNRPFPPSRIIPGTASDGPPRVSSHRSRNPIMHKKEWRDSEGWIGSSLRSPVRQRRIGISPTSRTSSPLSSTRSGPVFDPTAYQHQREARLKDAAIRRKRRELREISGGRNSRGCSRDSWIPRDRSTERSCNSPFSSPYDRGRRKKRFPLTTSKDKGSGYSSAGSQRTNGSAASSPLRRMDLRQVLMNSSPSQQPKSKQVNRSLSDQRQHHQYDASVFEEGNRTTAQRRKHIKKPVTSTLRFSTEEEPALTSTNANSIGTSSKVEELLAMEERAPKILHENSVKNGMLSIDTRLNALQDFIKMAKTGGIH